MAGWQKIPRPFARMLAEHCDGLEARIVWWMLGRVQVKQSRGKVRIPGTDELRKSVKGEIITSAASIGKDLRASSRSVRRRLRQLDRFSWITVQGSRGFAGKQGGTLVKLDLQAIESWDDRTPAPVLRKEIGQERRSCPKQTGTGDRRDRTPAPISVDVPASVDYETARRPAVDVPARGQPTGKAPAPDTAGLHKHPKGSHDTPTTTTTTPDTEPAELPCVREEYERLTKDWHWNGFRLKVRLDALLKARFRRYDSARDALAHVIDVNEDQTATHKPQALYHRVQFGHYPPSDEALHAARAVIDRGEKPLDLKGAIRHD